MIHDAVLDYYGRRLATCSSDRLIKLYEVSEQGETQKQLATLSGHEGPVWQVAWSHPKFGSVKTGTGLLASCSYDGKVVVWRQDANGSWQQFPPYAEHQASVNCVAWAPVEWGPLLLCGSSDGRVSVLKVEPDLQSTRQLAIFAAHQIGTNSVSWAPFEDGEQTRRFVSGGGDNLAKVWSLKGDSEEGELHAELEAVLDGHTDWVRDVAWSPSMLSRSYIASGSQDRLVLIWTQEPGTKTWQKHLLKNEPFEDVVCRLSWALSGNILAVSDGASKVTLWEEGLNGHWESAGEVTESSS